jgi:hypothetical protein
LHTTARGRGWTRGLRRAYCSSSVHLSTTFNI